MKRRRAYGTGSCRQIPSGKWYLEYKPKWSPTRISKTAEAANEKAAIRILCDWVTELDAQQGPKLTVSIDDLIALHSTDMKLNNCAPQNVLDTERKARKHLGKFFAHHDFATPLKKADIKRYKTARRNAGAAPGTINRELSWLHRGLVLANDDELISVAIPKIEKFDESSYIRAGVISEEDYYNILRRRPNHSQPVWCIAYRTGVRKGETLKLQTSWLLSNWKKPEPYIEIPGFDAKGNRITKTGKPHVIPLWHSEMRSMLEMVLSDPTRNHQCPYLFQRRGERLKSIRTGFEKARREAGLDSRQDGRNKIIFHDTRRSAVTRMDELGIEREDAMEMTGHLTESMYKRYRIGKTSKAVATGRKLSQFEAQRSKFAYESAYAANAPAAENNDQESSKRLN